MSSSGPGEDCRHGSGDAHRHPWKIGETGHVSGDDRSTRRRSRGRDDQFVCPAVAARCLGDREEFRVSSGDDQIVVFDLDSVEKGLNMGQTRRAVRRVRSERSEEQLGRGDRSDRQIVRGFDEGLELELMALDGDDDRAVEDQSGQSCNRSSRRARTAMMSSSAESSRGARDSNSMISRALPVFAGEILATVRPRRSTMNVSPACSTASSTSANCRAASVAVIRFIQIRLSDHSRIATERPVGP